VGRALANFRAALEEQDPKLIDETRAHLLDLLD
jgi:hypothetical protein